MQYAFNTDNFSNFKKTALLICNLFMNGQFRAVHLFTDSTLLAQQLLSNLNFICPTYIPIVTNPVTSTTHLSSWNQSQSTDYILQLICVDSLNGITDRFNDSTFFYTIYIVSFAEYKENLIWKLKKLHFDDVFSNSNSILLVYNGTLGTNEVYVRGSLEESIYVSDQSLTENMFAQTFGKLESSSLLAIQYTHETSCHSVEQNRRSVFPIIQQILANYYSSRMNITFLQGISILCEGGMKFDYFLHRSRNVYKELFFDKEPVNNKTIDSLEENYHGAIRLVFDSFHYFYENDRSQLWALYPYDSIKIKVILFYGSDFRRTLVPPGLFDLISIGKHWFLFMWFVLSILALHLIRSTVAGPASGISSSMWSMYIVWIGGGNVLQYKHRMEKFFLTMMFFAAFFVKAFGVGNFNSNIVMQGSCGIHTFRDLAKLVERPIFLNHIFYDKKDTVLMLLGNALGTSIKNAEFKYVQNIVELPQSSLFVTADYALSYAELTAENQKDFDVIGGSLGEFNDNYFLINKRHISKRIIQKFDQATISMIENGLHQFYWKFAKFLLQIRGNKGAYNADIVGKISLENFQFPLLLYTCLMVFAVVVLIGEIAYYHIRKSEFCRRIM